MSNYLYKCEVCEDIIDINLPMSSDPKYPLNLKGHKKSGDENFCYGFFRRIMRPWGQVKGFKTFAGDWYKKTYGKDIMEPYEDKRQRVEDGKRMRRELDKLKEE